MSLPVLSDQAERMLEFVSPRVGIIRNIARVSRGPLEPTPPIIYHVLLSNFNFKKASDIDRSAAGKGATENEAVCSAIGEALERYCASHPDPRRLVRLPWKAAGPNAISPNDCVLYSQRQYARPGFPYPLWQDTADIPWMTVNELPSRREVLAPATLVYLSYHGDKPEDFLCPPTSNGLAAGPDLDSAIRNGLYELIERDAFLITWMNKLRVPEIDTSRLAGLADSIWNHYRKFGTEVRIFHLATDLPAYVMMAIALDRPDQGPAAVVGLGCHPDPATATRKALFEVCQVRPALVRKYSGPTSKNRPGTYEEVRTLEDHCAFFVRPEALPELAFLLENSRKEVLDDLPALTRGGVKEDLDACVDALCRSNCRVIYSDLTTPDVAGYGIRVVRTIATGLQPMHFGYGEERLGGRRLFELPRTLGYADSPSSEESLNYCPHPLA